MLYVIARVSIVELLLENAFLATHCSSVICTFLNLYCAHNVQTNEIFSVFFEGKMVMG